jgi:hypothetical protein
LRSSLALQSSSGAEAPRGLKSAPQGDRLNADHEKVQNSHSSSRSPKARRVYRNSAGGGDRGLRGLL